MSDFDSNAPEGHLEGVTGDDASSPPSTTPSVTADVVALQGNPLHEAVEPGSLLAQASALAERGWFVFQVRGSNGAPDGSDWKHPMPGRWSIESSRDEAKLRQWFGSDDDYGIGIDCGKSGLVALDGDQLADLIEWADALAPGSLEGVTRWRGNPERSTFVFTQPVEGDLIGCPVMEWGEVRGIGGFVVGPHSPHDVGGRYRWDKDCDPVPLPPALADALRVGTKSSLRAGETTTDGGRSSGTPLSVRAFREAHVTETRPGVANEPGKQFWRKLESTKVNRHPAMQSAISWMVADVLAGFYSADRGIEALRPVWERSLADPPGGRKRRAATHREFDLMVAWSVANVDEDPTERLERVAESDYPEPTTLDGVDEPLTVAERLHLWTLQPERENEILARAQERWISAQAERASRMTDNPPFDWDMAMTGPEFMAMAPDADQYRIDGLWSGGEFALLSAQAKAGKTTLIVNLLHALTTGEPFLGMFGVTRLPDDRRIAVVDLELSKNTHRDWLSQRGVDVADLLLLHARGAAGSFGQLMYDPHQIDRAVEWLHRRSVGVLIVDPISPALQAVGADENSNSEVGAGLRNLVQIATRAGVDLLITHHAGHSEPGRTRGASAFLDVPAAIWSLEAGPSTGEPVEVGDVVIPAAMESSLFSARGRDVSVPKLTLRMDQSTKALTASDAAVERRAKATARAAKSVEDRAEAVLAALRDNGGSFPSANLLEDAVGGNAGVTRDALRALVAEGRVTATPTRNNAKTYSLPGFVPVRPSSSGSEAGRGAE